MKKILYLAFILFIAIGVLSQGSLAKVKKVKCDKPIYYFEEANKDNLFASIDELSQKSSWNVNKYYPQLGFISFKYHVKKEPEIVTLDLKQFSNDTYLFINISKNNTKLEKEIYEILKKQAKKSFLIEDEVLCKEFSKDIISIDKNRRSTIREIPKSDGVYRIGVHRYIGYDKKTYFKDKWNNFWKNLKKKNKKKNTDNI